MIKQLIIIIVACIVNTTYAQVSDFESIDFTIADNIAKLNKGNSLENLPLLAHKLTYKLPTEAEKFRAIYTWVCTNIKGDLSQDKKVTKKRTQLKNDTIAYLKWNNQYIKKVFKKLTKQKKTMCTGYAYLIKELCFLADIECKIINGFGRSTTSNIETLELANHSWNAVKLNNKWYLCDATWSSGYFLNGEFTFDYNLGYFLTEPVLFAKNHYPINKKWLLNDTLIAEEFVASPLVYNETFEHKVMTISPEQMTTTTIKNDVVDFSFRVLKTIETDSISLIHYAGDSERAFDIYDLKNDNGLITFKNQFKHKGFYDVHLKVNNDIVATYVIEVTKS